MLLAAASTLTLSFVANAPHLRPVRTDASHVMAAKRKEEFFPLVLPGFRPPSGYSGEKKSVQVSKFEAGEDYVFFQGPSPKTGLQEELPDFFSMENVQDAIDNLKITPLRLAIGAVGLSAFTVYAYTLVTAPGSKSPFAFLDQFYPPAIAESKVLEEKRAAAAAKAAAEKKAADAAKAAADAKAKAEAAAGAKAAPATK